MRKLSTIQESVASGVLNKIKAGDYPPGYRLPTELSLAEKFKVSRGTVRSALNILVDKGNLERRPNVGCFVRDEMESESTCRKITFLSPNNSDGIWPVMLRGMEQVAYETGIILGIATISMDCKEIEQKLTLLRKGKVDGIIFKPFVLPNYYEINNRILELFDRYGMKYVVIDTPIAANGVICGDFVGNDGYMGTRKVAKWLIDNGHTRIGTVRVFADVYTAGQRYQGVIDELNKHDLEIRPELHRVIGDEPIARQGRKEIREIMELEEPPTAVICNHDGLALNVIDELRKVGKKVPEDVSIFGFNDDYFSEPLGISTVRQPEENIGRRAVELLLKDSFARRQEFLPCEIIIRDSSRALI